MRKWECGIRIYREGKVYDSLFPLPHSEILIHPIFLHSTIPFFSPGRRHYGPEANCERSEVRLLPQSGRPLEDPSKGSKNNAIIKITNLYQGRCC
jgi:hypothetical protein